MNKKLLCTLLLAYLSILVIHAQDTQMQAISQSYQETNLEKLPVLETDSQQESLRKQTMKESLKEWHNFVLLNGAFSELPDYTFGLTYARVSKVGFYVNAMTNFNYHFPVEYEYRWRWEMYDNSYTPFYTGKKEYAHISTSAGVVVCLGIPLYAYAGLGYTYHSIFYETTDGQWIKYGPQDHFVNVEVGLMGQYKGFSLSVGLLCAFSTGSEECYHAKVGIGYCFKDKKK